jgi:hypothetical protein
MTSGFLATTLAASASTRSRVRPTSGVQISGVSPPSLRPLTSMTLPLLIHCSRLRSDYRTAAATPFDLQCAGVRPSPRRPIRSPFDEHLALIPLVVKLTIAVG